MSDNPIIDSLTARIEALIPTRPEIMNIRSPWDLFTVEGFKCSDIRPSFGDASAALLEAQRRFGEKSTPAALTAPSVRYRIKVVPNSSPNVDGRWIEVEKPTVCPTNGRFLAAVEFFAPDIPDGEHLVQYASA